jgi:hypothetical protein
MRCFNSFIIFTLFTTCYNTTKLFNLAILGAIEENSLLINSNKFSKYSRTNSKSNKKEAKK